MDLGVSGKFSYDIVISINSIYDIVDRIIYANPCKQSSYIRYAEQVGVTTMTFDNEQELMKIKQIHPNAK
jgi:diaminopimelate decarboxylase